MIIFDTMKNKQAVKMGDNYVVHLANKQQSVDIWNESV